MSVLNFGSLNIDYVYNVDHILLPGETQASGALNVFPGGKGLNQSIALAKAGVEVYHAGLVGEEGGLLLEECARNGVHTDYIRTIPGRSGHTIIQVDKNAQNSILLFGGANRQISREFIDEVLSHFGREDLLLLQNEINELPYIIDRAYEKGMRIILNPSPFDDALKACDLTKIYLFLVNEIEGWQITGEKEPEAILDKIRLIYPGSSVVLTLGSDGSVYQDQERRIRQGIFKVKAVDTTAAGDTFTGFFISSILEGMPVEEGLTLAARASAIAVTRAGAAVSVPTRDEVDASDF